MSDPSFEQLVALTEELLRIESVIGEERQITDWIEARLAKREPHALIRASNSLCVVPRALDADRKTLMLVGHVDTVPKLSENPVRRDGDRLHGLGASDMKAADALILTALERAFETAPVHNLIGVLYAREEGPFTESEMPLIHAAAESWFAASDFAICMEPTDNAIELGCLGTSHATVTFHGKRAHSARPWQGDNAIHKAAGLLARLAARERRRHMFQGLEFYEVVSATTTAFVGATNVVPERFDVNVNYRFAPGQDRADVERELADLVRDDGEFAITDFCPAGRVCRDNPVLEGLLEVLGQPEIRAKQAWTDVGRLSHMGLDAINFGPGATSQAHQANEWISLAELERAQRTMEAWLFSGGA